MTGYLIVFFAIAFLIACLVGWMPLAVVYALIQGTITYFQS